MTGPALALARRAGVTASVSLAASASPAVSPPGAEKIDDTATSGES
jgi:hypothetical protein